MTTPTTLAETIARVEQALAAEAEHYAENPNSWESVAQDEAVSALRSAWPTLLACARRCEAIDGVTSALIAKARRLARIDSWWRSDIEEFKRVLPPLLDAASERDALAKRVGELELDFANACDKGRRLLASNDSFMASSEAANLACDKAEAESTRLRAENERLQHRLSVRTDLEAEPELISAQDLLRKADEQATQFAIERNAAQVRVRELEEALAIVRHNNARLTEVSMLRSRLLAEHGIKEPLYPVTGNQPGPITDPTQGVVTLSMSNSPAACDERDWERGGRPACIPPDCQRFERLPSGIWAWVEGNVVCLRNAKVPDTVHYIFPGTLFANFQVDHPWTPITEPDFLAARALGVRVLGWKS